MTPSVLPLRLRPSGSAPFVQAPERTKASPSTMRRKLARISAKAMSATSSVSTSGVLVTLIPRACAVEVDRVEADAETGYDLKLRAGVDETGAGAQDAIGRDGADLWADFAQEPRAILR